jgi:hypothetical protein
MNDTTLRNITSIEELTNKSVLIESLIIELESIGETIELGFYLKKN